MMPKEKLIESIAKMFFRADETQLKIIYQFVLHISK